MLMFMFSLPDGGDRLISTSSLDYLYSDYGLVISEAPFNGEIEVQTRPGQRTWFNNSEQNPIAKYQAADTSTKLRLVKLGVWITIGLN